MSSLFFKKLTRIGIVLFALFVFLWASAVEAATLVASPSTGTYSAGQLFVVNINVASSDQAMNAVQGKIFFPKDTIEVVGISKTNSIVSLWVQEPAFSNTAGTISFEGVVFNPGYQGPAGKVVAITFRAKAPGGATATFSESTVLANDGAGTNILTGTVNGRYTITPRKTEPATPATPKPEKPVVVEEQKINPPVITQYPEVLEEGDLFKVQGNSYANAIVKIFISSNSNLITEDYVKTDSLGSFQIIVPTILKAGNYSFTLEVTTPEGKTSAKTESVTFLVQKMESFFKIGKIETTGFIFMLILFLILLSLALGFLYGYHKYVVIKKKLMMTIKHMRHAIHASLEPLRGKIEDDIHMLEEAKSKRALTVEEGLVLERQKKNNAELDDFLNKKIGAIEKLIDEGKEG